MKHKYSVNIFSRDIGPNMDRERYIEWVLTDAKKAFVRKLTEGVEFKPFNEAEDPVTYTTVVHTLTEDQFAHVNILLRDLSDLSSTLARITISRITHLLNK